MKEFNKKEYNLLCAKFLGAEITHPYPKNEDQEGTLIYFPKEAVTLGLYRNYSIAGLQFDKDWNWIMEVVDKIEHTIRWVNIKGCLVDVSNEISVSKPTKKEATIHAVWEILNKYYENNQ